MKIGPLFLVPSPDPSITFKERYDQVFEKVAYVNGRGYESVWFTEHHFSDYGYSPNPLMLLGHAAHIAPDLRLGTAVLVLPVWHPLRWAEDVAMLDVLSGGRVDVGIGRGYQEYEFGTFKADLSRNRDMFNESLDIALKAWTEDDMSYAGEFWNIPTTTVFPKPMQTPHPPIWMAATTPPSIRSAIERGFHLSTGTGSVYDELLGRNAYIDTVLDDLGRSPEGLERAANRFVFCSTSQDEINEAIEAARWQIRVSRGLRSGHAPAGGRNVDPPSYAGEQPPELWQERMVIGDPDECTARIQKLGDAGVTYIYGLFEMGGLSHDASMRSMKLFTEEVMPALPEISARRMDRDEREQVVDSWVSAPSHYAGV